MKVQSLEELDRLAERLAPQLKPGDGVALIGEMGAGKTTLVRALMRAWNYSDPVVSPTYPILVEYELPNSTKVIHIDAYRLEAGQPLPFDPREWKSQNAIVFVEWPERLKLSEGVLTKAIQIESFEDGSRNILFVENWTS